MITKDDVAAKMSAFLRHEITEAKVVDWAETAMRNAEFHQDKHDAIRDAVARIGAIDVRQFGLTVADCEAILDTLGYQLNLEITAR
ncbi:MAG: hypothetical protein P9L94_12630 [Candidatus Hinthialibacter antarcticus]|nr:hypothetical protein [Candidatus Hinthialibacter antarcticus]